jgi:hypothetical protein
MFRIFGDYDEKPEIKPTTVITEEEKNDQEVPNIDNKKP